MSQVKEPAYRVRIGKIGATVWAQPTKNGTLYNTTLTRSYQDPQTGNWTDASSFGIEDMCVLIQVATQATAWIVRQMDANRAAAANKGGQHGPVTRNPAGGGGGGGRSGVAGATQEGNHDARGNRGGAPGGIGNPEAGPQYGDPGAEWY